MQLNRANSILFVPALFVVFAGLFYWYEYRPTEIRRECSWTPYTIPAKEAFSGVTKEEADEKNEKATAKCRKTTLADLNDKTWESVNEQAEIDTFCNVFPAKEEPPRPAEPERTAWRQSTDREYTQCLRNNGL